jgi:hypothetical protein
VIRDLLFELIYPILLRRDGNPVRPIRRRVHEADGAIRQAFDAYLDALMGEGGPVPYNLAHPKIDFLNYVCDWRGFVAHGSQLDNLTVLQPVRRSSDSTEFGNRRQVFCSPDATWAMWFAILDKQKFRTTRNGCVRIGKGSRRRKYYHFGLPADQRASPPFSTGSIYLARADDFPSRHEVPSLRFIGAAYEEWGSETPVEVLARLRVSPQDFPYLNRVGYYL